MEISVYTNRHGQQNFGLVLGYGNNGVAQLLLDPFDANPNASTEAQRTRVRWVQPVPAAHEGPGTKIVPLNGQRISWQTPEIRELIAGGPAAIEARRTELYQKFCA